MVPGTGPLPQTPRLAMLQSARDEYAKWMAQRRIALGLKKQVPFAADDVYVVGDMVYVWRETPRIWIGPFSILGIDGKNVNAKVDSKAPKPFSVSCVKRAVTPLDVRWTKVLTGNDPPTKSPEMEAAIRAEIVSLIKCVTFRLVVISDEHGGNVVPSPFFFAVKHWTKGETKYKT